MKITRDNYEIYFIDYLDGTLSPELIAELKGFLLVNRDLEEQLQAVENSQLTVSSEQFPDKESLKKDITHECPDYYAIATAENALSENDRKALGKRIDTPVFQTLVQSYRMLKLEPDLNIHFVHKARLYRKNTHRIFLYRTAGIAAGLLLLAGIGMSLLQTRQSQSSAIPSYSFVLLQPEEVILPAEPQDVPAKQAEQTRYIPPKNNIPKPAKKITKQPQPMDTLLPLPTVQPVFTLVENDLPENPLELINRHPASEEIFLTLNAQTWKQSGEGFLDDNIIGSAYYTGKSLAGKIKEKIAEIRSNKSIPEYVIE